MQKRFDGSQKIIALGSLLPIGGAMVSGAVPNSPAHVTKFVVSCLHGFDRHGVCAQRRHRTRRKNDILTASGFIQNGHLRTQKKSQIAKEEFDKVTIPKRDTYRACTTAAGKKRWRNRQTLPKRRQAGGPNDNSAAMRGGL